MNFDIHTPKHIQLAHRPHNTPLLPIPICKRNLTYKDDGAKYYRPQPIYIDGKLIELADIRKIFSELSSFYCAANKNYFSNTIITRIEFEEIDDLIQQLPDTYSEKLNILKNWMNEQIEYLYPHMAQDLDCSQKDLYYDYQIYFRTPKGHDKSAGLFHKDGIFEKNEKSVQIILGLNPDEFGTVFKTISKGGDIQECNPVSHCKGDVEYYKDAKRIGIAEQANPDLFFAMRRHPLTIGHCVPANIDPDNTNPVRRPLIGILFYTDND